MSVSHLTHTLSLKINLYRRTIQRREAIPDCANPEFVISSPPHAKLTTLRCVYPGPLLGTSLAPSLFSCGHSFIVVLFSSRSRLSTVIPFPLYRSLPHSLTLILSSVKSPSTSFRRRVRGVLHMYLAGKRPAQLPASKRNCTLCHTYILMHRSALVFANSSGCALSLGFLLCTIT